MEVLEWNMEQVAEKLAARLDGAATPGELEILLSEIHELVAGAVRGGDALELGRLASRLYDRLFVRAAALAWDGHEVPQKGYALVVLGSQGRREQFLATDQDNALILEDGADAGFFAAFAGRLADILAASGMPPCQKGIMAATPAWRRSLSGWRDVLYDVADRPDAEGVLTVSLLADMRPVAGDFRLAAEVAGYLRRRVAEAPLITRGLAREALRFGPPAHLPGHLPLGLFGCGQAEIDLKRQAVYPLVLGMKALALDVGLPETQTVSRLAALAGQGLIGDDLAARLIQAFSHAQSLRLSAQADAFRLGRPMDNRIAVSGLDERDRQRLRRALDALDRLSAILEHHFGLRYLT